MMPSLLAFEADHPEDPLFPTCELRNGSLLSQGSQSSVGNAGVPQATGDPTAAHYTPSLSISPASLTSLAVSPPAEWVESVIDTLL